jgi:hypothetical protein
MHGATAACPLPLSCASLLQARYAYPAIVWYDLFTEVTDEWLNMAEALQARWHTAISSADAAAGGSRPVAAAGSVESQ